MSKICLSENNDKKKSAVKSIKSDNCLRYKGLSSINNNNDDDTCNEECVINDPENQVKGFNETFK